MVGGCGLGTTEVALPLLGIINNWYYYYYIKIMIIVKIIIIVRSIISLITAVFVSSEFVSFLFQMARKRERKKIELPAKPKS